jgi:hypothetical protein
MSSARVLILTAVVPEARALSRDFSLRLVGDCGMPFWRADDLALAAVGVRAGRLDAVAKLVPRPEGVIMAGVAGALSPELAVGDVVVDARRLVPGIEGAIVGRLHTATAIVGTAAEKASLFASSGCLAVDMETEVVANWAAARGAAFVGVRGISDRADEPLDPALLTLVDAEGRPRVGRAVGMLCRHPGKLGAMLRLGRATKVAMEGVARTVGKIVASGWPHTPA